MGRQSLPRSLLFEQSSNKPQSLIGGIKGWEKSGKAKAKKRQSRTKDGTTSGLFFRLRLFFRRSRPFGPFLLCKKGGEKERKKWRTKEGKREAGLFFTFFFRLSIFSGFADPNQRLGGRTPASANSPALSSIFDCGRRGGGGVGFACPSLSIFSGFADPQSLIGGGRTKGGRSLFCKAKKRRSLPRRVGVLHLLPQSLIPPIKDWGEGIGVPRVGEPAPKGRRSLPLPLPLFCSAPFLLCKKDPTSGGRRDKKDPIFDWGLFCKAKKRQSRKRWRTKGGRGPKGKAKNKKGKRSKIGRAGNQREERKTRVTSCFVFPITVFCPSACFFLTKKSQTKKLKKKQVWKEKTNQSKGDSLLLKKKECKKIRKINAA